MSLNSRLESDEEEQEEWVTGGGVTSEGAAALSIRRFVRTADDSPNMTPKDTDPAI